ncbi:non-ribosomal peptide synthetase, partial [Myxococcaceae bacterium JPH2]|nr:non-ribosomal peptide synthetase [Myxococcaceae bacterium JPH2]
VEWNDTHASLPDERSIHQRFQSLARLFPHSPALVFQGLSLSYQQLDERSNQLAHLLLSRGVSPGSFVALFLERSFDLFVSLLAILKAGAAYLPLDSSFPKARLALLLSDSSPSLLLSHSHLSHLLPSSSVPSLLLDSSPLDSFPSSPPLSFSSPLSLAYLLFTSGSTGRPKGVLVPHQAVLRLVSSSPSFIRFGPSFSFLQLAPTSFDASTLEIWGALLHGAPLFIPPPHPLSLEDIASLIRLHSPSSLWLTSALFDSLCLHHPDALALVPQLLSGGDVLSPSLVRNHLSRLPPLSSFTNGYGPTENTTFSSTHSLSSSSSFSSSVPIGRPLPLSSTFVLDDSLLPCPIGVPGELFVGGLGLAWGYLSSPHLSAERFLPNPFSSSPGQRLYKTGDKARWLSDGSLQFLGRSDFQVKLRGFRIELPEVEAALLSLPSVLEASVLLRHDSPGDKRLVAYLVSSSPLSSDSLRSSLRASLPEFMVPSSFVFLPALPLTLNGKVDRNSLPPPDLSSQARPFSAPRTHAEEQVAAAFAEVLRLERVGLDDDFFTLGGHSLLAVRLMSLLRERTGRVLPLSALFQSSTVEQLARWVEPTSRAALGPNLERLDAGTSEQHPLFLIHGGGGGVLSYTELVRHLGETWPLYGVFASGLEGGVLPPNTMESLAGLYVAQLREVQPRGPYRIAGWSLGGAVAFEMARQLQSHGETVEFLALLDSLAPSTEPEPAPPPLARLVAFGQMAGLSIQDVPAEALEHLSDATDEALLPRMIEVLRGLPAAGGLDASHIERLFSVHERLGEAYRNYVPANRYAGTAELFRATQRPSARAEDEGWSQWLTEAVRVSPVPGTHTSLLEEPHVRVLVELLDERLRLLDASAPVETKPD